MVSDPAPARERASASSSAGVRIQRGRSIGLLLYYATGDPVQASLPRFREENGLMKIAGSTTVITGGASGLGRATAERMLGGGGRAAPLDPPTSAGGPAAQALGPDPPLPARAVTQPPDVPARPPAPRQ